VKVEAEWRMQRQEQLRWAASSGRGGGHGAAARATRSFCNNSEHRREVVGGSGTEM
jgi:hypothetical protein